MVPFTSTVAADLRIRMGSLFTVSGLTVTLTDAVATPPAPLPTSYSMGGRTPGASSETVNWRALPPATMATEPSLPGSAETLSMTTDVQSTLGSLSITRSTVARPARTPYSSSAAWGGPTSTVVQSGGSLGRSVSAVLSSSVVVSSDSDSGGLTSSQFSTRR